MQPSIILLIILLIIYLLAVWRWVWPRLPAYGIILTIVLCSIHGLLIATYLYTRANSFSDLTQFWRWYFNYKHGEFNPTATFNATQLVMAGLLGLGITTLANISNWRRLYWLGLAACFMWLGYDEYMVFHENLGSAWVYWYAGTGALLMLLGALLYFKPRRDWLPLLLIFGGLGIAAGGAVGLEILAAADCFGYLPGICREAPLIEEFAENIGVLTAILGFMMIAYRHITPQRWGWLRNALSLAVPLVAIILLFGLWVVPPLEARFIAQPLNISYQSPDVELVGYHISTQSLQPSQDFDISIYWRQNGVMDRSGRYGISTHLSDPGTGIGVSGTNKLIDTPQIYQAYPGAIYRATLPLHVPEDIVTPASYNLSVAFWQETGPDYYLFPIQQTDQPLLAPDAAILQSMPVIAPADIKPAETTALYRFGQDVALTDYDISQTDDTLYIRFDWHKTGNTPLPADYKQFVHFMQDGELAYGLDHPPMLGRFPTSQWPADLHANAPWQIPLPDDLPTGTYTLFTGLYHPTTGERLPVTDAEGTIQPSAIVELGIITIAP